MLQLFYRRLSAALFTLAVFLSPWISTFARADSFRLHSVSSANSIGLYGIDSIGDVVTSNASCQGACFATYSSSGALLGNSTLPPALSYSNGSACSSSLPSGFAGASVCNGSFEVIGGDFYNPSLFASVCGSTHSAAEQDFCANGYLQGIWAGSGTLNPFTSLISASLTADQIALNASGDFAFTSGLDETIYEAVLAPNRSLSLFAPTLAPTPVLPTPEPSSILLLGTGCISLLSFARRHLSR